MRYCRRSPRSSTRFAQRLRDAPEAKARLAEAAFALLSPRETVFLDASSTTYYVARLIAMRGLPLRVITNSLPILHELSGADQADIEVVAIGGTFRRVPCSYVGPQRCARRETTSPTVCS